MIFKSMLLIFLLFCTAYAKEPYVDSVTLKKIEEKYKMFAKKDSFFYSRH